MDVAVYDTLWEVGILHNRWLDCDAPYHTPLPQYLSVKRCAYLTLEPSPSLRIHPSGYLPVSTLENNKKSVSGRLTTASILNNLRETTDTVHVIGIECYGLILALESWRFPTHLMGHVIDISIVVLEKCGWAGM